MLTWLIMAYFALHAYMLKIYHYHQLSGHMLYIMFLQIYLVFYKQSQSYTLLKELAQNRSKQQPNLFQPPNHCKICNQIKPSRYYHCRRCNRCIYRMDHHCQWISNCIGQYNSKPYSHFLLNLFMHNTIVILYIFIGNFRTIFTNQDRSVYLLILILPAILILFQTQRLLRDFYSMVTLNQTLIESYKKVRGKNMSVNNTLSQFLGSPYFLLWCIPVYLPFQNPSKSSDLFQKTLSIDQGLTEPEDCTYADEYLYGKDDEDQQFNHQKPE